MSVIPTISIPKIIIHDNKFCQLITDNTVLFNTLRNKLSFKLLGVEYSQAYQNGWNGITYLLNKKGMFHTGLLFKVRKYFQDNNIHYQEEDKRSPIVSAIPIDLSTKLQQLNMVPREHQLRILGAIKKNDRGIVRAVTAAGKSLVTALATAHFNKPTIIYVIGLDLLQQFHDLYSSLFDEPIGFIGNGVCDIQRINIASIWTIGSALKVSTKDILADNDDDEEKTEVNERDCDRIIKMLQQTKIHILDESHVCSTNTLTAIYKEIMPERIYGVSGTPFREDNSDLLIHGILGEKIIDVSASELIDKGLLAKPIIRFVDVPKISISGSANYQTIYKNAVVENEQRNQLIIENTQKLVNKGYTPLVLFKQIKHGKILLEMMQQQNLKCEMLYGNDSLEHRNEVKQQINNGDVDILLASTIADIGFDLPKLSGLVLCGSGKSSLRCNQRLGRVCRIYPGKTNAVIIDFYDPVKYLKQHSIKRYKVYASEKGFDVKASPKMSVNVE